MLATCAQEIISWLRFQKMASLVEQPDFWPSSTVNDLSKCVVFETHVLALPAPDHGFTRAPRGESLSVRSLFNPPFYPWRGALTNRIKSLWRVADSALLLPNLFYFPHRVYGSNTLK